MVRECSASNEHRWVVCMCVQLVEAAMESRDVVGVISPRETCSLISSDAISVSRAEGRVTVEKKLRMSAPCFHKQYPSSLRRYARLCQQ